MRVRARTHTLTETYYSIMLNIFGKFWKEKPLKISVIFLTSCSKWIMKCKLHEFRTVCGRGRGCITFTVHVVLIFPQTYEQLVLIFNGLTFFDFLISLFGVPFFFFFLLYSKVMGNFHIIEHRTTKKSRCFELCNRINYCIIQNSTISLLSCVSALYFKRNCYLFRSKNTPVSHAIICIITVL